MSAPFDSRLGMEVPDYLSALGSPIGKGTFGSRNQRSSYPPGFEPETMMSGPEQYIDELVRRTNLMVQFVNSQIRPGARYCQLQPKMCHDAKFPPEFRIPKTVDEVRAMDPSSVDRVLRAYNLPTDLRSFRAMTQDTINPRTAHQAKLCTLFDFLGATQISERQRSKRNNGPPY
ncbi:hypothetical protein DPSP01_003025 [Paraphaeosphaeria sporulosa]|uniref:Uncharacterized protein n=1 Tax=Paraphaeosphaeria sporulosa TaxID=1460663 RepID=A0A177CMW5_9PLEO|nr:uncharacterized protein CC84DRAFT_1214651 [Paraphaeosphaeria sporulosa]OAG08117.1 hypothetical protein CC84DRAFT_1214651 [Paraphaeosphaeria sporulosa]